MGVARGVGSVLAVFVHARGNLYLHLGHNTLCSQSFQVSLTLQPFTSHSRSAWHASCCCGPPFSPPLFCLMPVPGAVISASPLTTPLTTTPTYTCMHTHVHAPQVWDLRQRKCVYTIPGHRSLVSSVRYDRCAQGAYIVTGGYDCLVKVLGVQGCREGMERGAGDGKGGRREGGRLDKRSGRGGREMRLGVGRAGTQQVPLVLLLGLVCMHAHSKATSRLGLACCSWLGCGAALHMRCAGLWRACCRCQRHSLSKVLTHSRLSQPQPMVVPCVPGVGCTGFCAAEDAGGA